MKTKVAILAVTPFFAISFANASDVSTVYSGAGAGTCAEFAEMYDGSPAQARSVYMGWAQGFLSGANAVALGRVFSIELDPDRYYDAKAHVKWGGGLSAYSALQEMSSDAKRTALESAVDLRPPSLDLDSQFGHLRRFCDERPLADFVEAVLDLRAMLATQTRKQGMPAGTPGETTEPSVPLDEGN